MWPPWSRSPGRIHHRGRTNTTCSPTTSSSFACSTFKDIESICSEDSNSNSGSNSAFLTRLPSICHRVRVTNQIVRAWSIPESLLLLDSIQDSKPAYDSATSDNPEIPNAVDSSKRSDLCSKNVVKSEIPIGADSSKRNELGPSHVAKSTETVPTGTDSDPMISVSGTEARIVIYYTSLRVVRPTFEACKSTLAVLKSFSVPIDERDLLMDASFLPELKRILKDQTLTLPRVFIGGRYVGGADEVRQLHECGELKKLLVGLPTVETGVCQACGGFLFLLCGECSGGRKIYSEKGGFRSCTVCNENGLVKCPNCSFQSPIVTFRH